MAELGDSYNHLKSEDKWASYWEKEKTYAWNPVKSREETFVIDTPPPTVSGSLHVGHVFSYTQTDIIARFNRMSGKNIFYPIGWDDNGLPTERRVQNYFNIRCNPTLPYQPNWTPSEVEDKKSQPQEVSRKNFIEACALLTEKDEQAFEHLWRRLGLSFDWNQQYATIDEHCRRLSQYSFLDLIDKGEVYNAESPFLWDVDDQTAVAQAETEDREISGAYHDIGFGIKDGGEFIISTTRPELLGACIAVAAHPEDARYKHLFGKTAITPLFYVEVPIVPSEHADPEKGSGILMICTFGDTEDVEFWRKNQMPLRQIIGRDGRLLNITFGEGRFPSSNATRANATYAHLSGLVVKRAQKRIIELLSEEGSSVDGKERALKCDPKPIKHPVRFYERGHQPLEIIPTRQWFIKLLDHKEALLQQGQKINWHPSHMLTRYENWVNGLNQDWCISRQRFFGVSFPVWYPIANDGTVNYDSPIFAQKESLPVDPQIDAPPGYDKSMRNKPGGFIGDPDVMDTWATSSLTPQISSHWNINPERHIKLFPADVRPQAHEIIRTWAFYTIAKAWFHEKEIPWKNALISGWILDPDRKKMSKSKGNVVTPENLLVEYSSDAVRYWAARARLGADTAFDAGVFKIGRKLSTKLFNASRFILSHFERTGLNVNSMKVSDINEPIDIALIQRMKKLVSEVTEAYKNFDYAQGLQLTEDLFWNFCDNYLELTKGRAYKEDDKAKQQSVFAALAWSLKTFLRLFAPVLPYVTEEIWSKSFGSDKQSIHTSAWPSVSEVYDVSDKIKESVIDAASEVISKIRGAKTSSKRGLRWPVAELKISGDAKNLEDLNLVMSDVLEAGNVRSVNIKNEACAKANSGMFVVDVILSDQE